MRNFINDTWRYFKEIAKNRDVYIWGAGYRRKEICHHIKNGLYSLNLVGFIDIDTNKTSLAGYDVFHPSVLMGKDPEEYVVLISIDCPGVVAKQLDKLGTQHYFSYFWLMNPIQECRIQKNIDYDAVETLNAILFDKDSKDFLKAIIEKRKIGMLDYSDIAIKGNEYCRNEFFSHTEADVFVDGGAFDGDTITEIVDWTKNKYKKIYSFEPDLRMYKLIENRLHRWHDVVIYNKGLYDKNCKKSFHLDNIVFSSRISTDEEDAMIDCIPLDDVLKSEKCSFIKFDIEGAEIQALNGAKNTILRDKPNLAICIYHMPNDLWGIPLLIHNWVPSYKMHIRHFSQYWWDTILYAHI